MLRLGLDVGGSATRWVLMRRAEVAARGETEGFSGHLFDSTMIARVEALLQALARDLAGHGRIAAVAAGVTGTAEGAETAHRLATLLAAAFDAPLARVRVVGDMVVAHRAAFPPGQGILLYAGTGSVAAHVDAAGQLHTAGGRGSILDDGGSAHWLAVRALRRVLRQEDAAPGSGWATPLGQSLAAAIGGVEWDRVRAAIYGRDRGAVAALARYIVDADDLFDAAAAELIRLVHALRQRIGCEPVVASGRALALSPRLVAGLVLDGQPVPVVSIDSGMAAALLAGELP
ncbi:MAG: ATPase [Alphaproteobacteria bacterium]|nr:BadF/BadG/BcrA/BcrD ATPase family protein [Alphaproteobacteria bacterium]TAD89841.1 MAG: ATPase [Alphaproteobacteria bacterium]